MPVFVKTESGLSMLEGVTCDPQTLTISKYSVIDGNLYFVLAIEPLRVVVS